MKLFGEWLPGGKAPGGLCPRGVDPREVARGVLVEMEHTNDSRIAREIACDHLAEDPAYYTKLATIHLDGSSSTKRWLIGGFTLAAVGLLGAVVYFKRRR